MQLIETGFNYHMFNVKIKRDIKERDTYTEERARDLLFEFTNVLSVSPSVKSYIRGLSADDIGEPYGKRILNIMDTIIDSRYPRSRRLTLNERRYGDTRLLTDGNYNLVVYHDLESKEIEVKPSYKHLFNMSTFWFIYDDENRIRITSIVNAIFEELFEENVSLGDDEEQIFDCVKRIIGDLDKLDKYIYKTKNKIAISTIEHRVDIAISRKDTSLSKEDLDFLKEIDDISNKMNGDRDKLIARAKMIAECEANEDEKLLIAGLMTLIDHARFVRCDEDSTDIEINRNYIHINSRVNLVKMLSTTEDVYKGLLFEQSSLRKHIPSFTRKVEGLFTREYGPSYSLGHMLKPRIRIATFEPYSDKVLMEFAGVEPQGGRL